MVVILSLIQDRLLYFPEPMNRSTAESVARILSLVPWTAADLPCAAFVREPASGKVKGNVVVFHGNAGTALDRIHYASALSPLGYRVFLVEYPGYGAVPGRHSETDFRNHALAVIDRIVQEYGRPVYLFGESLGAAVAASAAAAAGRNKVDGMALITPWDTLPDLAQSKYWFLPARLLVKDRYDNISNANVFGGPVAVLIAENDRVVPRPHSERLFDSLRTWRMKLLFDGSGHNDWPSGPEETWWSEVLDFLGMPPHSAGLGDRNRRSDGPGGITRISHSGWTTRSREKQGESA